jgi:rhodanese-related sulfurtransferase
MKQIICILLASGLMAVVLWYFNSNDAGNSRVILISPEAVVDQPLWIDARSASEFGISHIPGAVNVTEDDWDEGFNRLASIYRPGRKMVVYCGAESCHASREVALRLLRELRTDKIYVLKGGFEAWQLEQGSH